jgi:hypothetical protein
MSAYLDKDSDPFFALLKLDSLFRSELQLGPIEQIEIVKGILWKWRHAAAKQVESGHFAYFGFIPASVTDNDIVSRRSRTKAGKKAGRARK